jgi:hypothetical protein
MIVEIYLEVQVFLSKDFDPQREARRFIFDFQGALTHEIAHA